MIKALPIQEKSLQKDLCEKCGLTYLPDAMAYAAYSDGTPIGCVQFSIKEGYGIVYNVATVPGMEENVNEITMMLGRTALNFVDLLGTHFAWYGGKDVELDDAEKRKAVVIGFELKGNTASADLIGFFDSPCCKHK